MTEVDEQENKIYKIRVEQRIKFIFSCIVDTFEYEKNQERDI